MFPTYDEYKSHTYRHFNTKTCPLCHVLLIQICGDEWFCLHTPSNCQHSHKLTTASNSDSDAPPMMVIKQELHPETDSHLNTDIETGAKNGLHTVFLHHSNTDYQSIIQTTQFDVDEKHADSWQSQDTGWNDSDEVVDDYDKKYIKPKMDNRREDKSSHDSVKPQFPCFKCGRTYSSRSNLLRHFKRHEEDNYVDAPDGQVFGGVDEEKVMRRTKNCAKNELTQPNYLVEVLLDEQAALEKSQASEFTLKRRTKVPSHAHRPKTFTCDFCQKTLASYYSIKEHMQSKHSAKRKAKLAVKHMCSVCGKQFTDRSNMRVHERTHSAGNKTTCDVCGKKLTDKKGLVKHMKVVHEKERRHHCNIDGCEWTFGHSGALKRHQARRHGLVTQPNACPICGKEFPNSTYHLNRHLKAHANNTAKVHIPDESKRKPAETSEVLN
ncbi:hypothetical protein HA402_000213 [Bradysia odoriphaga]|nr:hypothetical protein HA402_000213 [Bradysia odoriphaga]